MSLIFALQALLVRHETYVAEAEEERRKTEHIVDKLERDKRALEAANARTIEENRYLLDQLEELNNNASDSDAQIVSLNATLQSTQRELDKFASLAEQTAQLEAQISAMEAEQAELHGELLSKNEESQTAAQRWKSAERKVAALLEQLDRIEKELAEERQRHAEITTRLDRRRMIEKELKTTVPAAGTPSTTRQDSSGSTVVSSFVKDILQDNANLQMGILELREMLMGSNKEVENLRERMMFHRPVEPDSATNSEEPLSAELLKTPTAEAPDFHVHHHYHAAPEPAPRKAKTQIQRRVSKKRLVSSPGFRTPLKHEPPTVPLLYNAYGRPTTSDSTAAILSQTSITIPPSRGYFAQRRDSTESSNAPFSAVQSSVPDSPASAYREQSVFDTDGLSSSRPTSAASTDLDTLDFRPRHFQRLSDVSVRSLDPPWTSAAPSASRPYAGKMTEPSSAVADHPALDHSTILEEPDENSPQQHHTLDEHDVTVGRNTKPLMIPGRGLHRSSSAESMLSVRGVDIPQLRTRQSQLLQSTRGSLATFVASVGPVTSSTSAVGRSSKGARHYDSSNYNRLLLANASNANSATKPQAAKAGGTIGKKLGGWMSGKWGVAPTAAGSDVSSVKSNGGKESKKASRPLSTHVEAEEINNALLQEALEG